LYCTYGGRDGMQVALRSKNIYGPYEQKLLIYDTTKGINYGIHQGALIQTQTGEWWTILFVDSGPFGRFPSLQPVTWIDGWPMVGIDGKAVVTFKKPKVGKTYPIKDFPKSDEFNEKRLGMQWGWNHNPDSTKWSLSKRHGYLRLITATVTNDFTMARNTLTQRPFVKRDQSIPTVATTKMDVSKMKDGDIAGLAVFQEPYAFIAVKQQKTGKHILMVNDGKVSDSADINASAIYLRTIASNATDKASFEYSTDNKTFKQLGNDLMMRFSLKIFTGNKFCLFNYATEELGGYVDVDWFRVK
jgi:beta-xylosidase